jgi:Tfp pilus assembly pilus retraction ATPase PilT
MTVEDDGWRRTQKPNEWTNHVPEVGTIRAQIFVDAADGGLIVRIPGARAAHEQAAPPHVRMACEAREGLIIVSASVAEDVAAMVQAVVGWYVWRHPGYVVAFGTDLDLEGLPARAFLSERMLPETETGVRAAIRDAIREGPDALIVTSDTGDVRPSDAIIAAAVGRLVITGVVARTSPDAIQVVLRQLVHQDGRDMFAEVFRSACCCRRVRRSGEKRLVVWDILTAGAGVAPAIRHGDIAELERMQSKRQHGMRTVDAALAAAVGRGMLTLREAAAAAVDRTTLCRRVVHDARVNRAALSAGAGRRPQASAPPRHQQG